jgi:YVTN family beta-propeller protein
MADLPRNKVIATVTVGTEPSGLAVTPNTNAVYVANVDSNTVTVIKTPLNKGARQIRIILYAKELFFRSSAFAVSHRYARLSGSFQVGRVSLLRYSTAISVAAVRVSTDSF